MSSSTSGSSGSRYAIWLVASLVVITAAAVGVVQWAWTHYGLFARISPMRYQLYLAEREARKIAVLSIGDSHAALGLFPPDGSGVANVAYAGENLRETRLKVRYLLPLLPRVKTVLVQSQPQMLFPHRDRPATPPYQELGGSGTFHPFERWLSQFHPCCRGRAPREALLALAGRLEKGAGPDVLANGYLNYAPYVTYERARFGELAAAEIKSYEGARPVPALVDEFGALLDELRSAGVRVVLVKYPLSRAYWDAIGEQRMREVDALFARAAEVRSLERCGTWAPQPDALHFNPDHLTQAAAKQYWTVIARCALP